MPYQSKVMSEDAVVGLSLHKVTEPKKQKLKVEILHNLKEI